MYFVILATLYFIISNISDGDAITEIAEKRFGRHPELDSGSISSAHEIPDQVRNDDSGG